MDEVEVIQNYLLSQAGDDTDVILGLGYDESLDRKIGITLIATGFQHKDPFAKPVVKKPVSEEKIIMVLGQQQEVKKEIENIVESMQEEETVEHSLVPKLVEFSVPDMSIPSIMMFEEEELMMTDDEIPEIEPQVIHWELNMSKDSNRESTRENFREITVEKLSETVNHETLHSITHSVSLSYTERQNSNDSTNPVSAASGGYLARPSNIYAESKVEVSTSMPSAEEPVPAPVALPEDDLQMQLVVRDDIPAADLPLAHHAQQPLTAATEDSAMRDEVEEQKRRAAERIQKLRNLSFNINNADPNNEFENVPAYIRRNMELYGSSYSAIENFYSSYEVRKDENNQTNISTINTFLDGNKPD
jgi:cell division protein FtsZ